MRAEAATASVFKQTGKLLPTREDLLERDQRLESMKVLAGQLAHDLNNSLVPILGYTTIVKDEIGQDSPAFEYVHKLEAAARKSEAFLAAILLAVRPHRRFTPKSVDLAALLQETLNEWLLSLPPSAAITVESHFEPCTVWLDRDHWRQLFQQLLHNARFALATGGTLKISLDNVTISQQKAAELGLNDTRVIQLIVEDDGFGMPANVLRRACEPFFTTRPKGQAAGLGLTIVHSIVQLHGGQLVLESVEDQGTKVCLWFPSQTSGPDSKEAELFRPRASHTPLPSTSTKLLLLVHEPLAREVIRARLQTLPLEVLIAAGVPEAEKLCQKHGSNLAAAIIEIESAASETKAVELSELIQGISPNAQLIWLADEVHPKSLAKFPLKPPSILIRPFALKSLADLVKGSLPQSESP